MSFVHLHLHTDSSLLDGAIQIEPLVERVEAMGQSAVAITDHGWCSGAVKLVKAAKDKGIKPIIGCEVYVAAQPNMEQPAEGSGDMYHLTLLAATPEGYRNLSRITTEAHLRGFSYKPRVDYHTLGRYQEGIIVLSGCVGAPIPQAFAQGNEVAARELGLWFRDTFEGRFFVELQTHGKHGSVDHVRVTNEQDHTVMSETDLNMALVDLANKLGVGVVATNDAHYLTREDGEAHDTLLCLGMGAWKDKDDRMAFPGEEHGDWQFYVKDEKEMLKASKAKWWQTACSNTKLVADMVEDNVLVLGQQVMPKYEVPTNDTGFRVWRETGEFI